MCTSYRAPFDLVLPSSVASFLPPYRVTPGATHSAAAAHVQVESGIEPGIEYDSDSETELESSGRLASAAPPSAPVPLRFKLLHELWAAGVPRKRSSLPAS